MFIQEYHKLNVQSENISCGLEATKDYQKKKKKVVQSFLRLLSLTFSMIPTSCRMNLYVKSRVFFMKSIIPLYPPILRLFMLLFLQTSYASMGTNQRTCQGIKFVYKILGKSLDSSLEWVWIVKSSDPFGWTDLSINTHDK